MSGSVDDEIVRMRFDNSGFAAGVSKTIDLLSRLKNNLNFSGAGKGLNDIEGQANKFSMANVSKQIDDSAHHWSAWRTAGLIAFATVVHQAVRSGEQLLASFTIDPIKDGFQSYETQINAAKTIMSNTGAKLPAIEKQLSQLQTYANQTVYSFADMSSAIGTFTAAGVKLNPAVQAIKGLGNTAALSGVDATRLSGAYVQVSQALSTGVFRLQDWNSLSQAGLGGQNIQKALESTAETIKGSGPKMDAAIKKYGNFRNSLTSGWLTGDIFNKTMGVMAGKVDAATGKTVAYSVAELKAKGYTTEHAIALHNLSQASIESATQIRTYTQLTQALKEEVGTAYGAIFKTIFGNLNGATVLFTALHNAAENALTKPIYDLNNLLKGAAALGARADAIDAFKNVFKSLDSVIAPVKAAFREIFPKETAAGLAALIARFDDFTKKLKVSADTANNIKRIFAGVFAVFDIGKQVVLGIFHAIGTLLGAVAHGSGGFLTFAASVGDMVVEFDKALKSGGLIHNFFSIIGNVLSIPIQLFGTLGTVIGALFSGFHKKDADGMTNSVTNAGTALGKVSAVTKKLSDFFGSLSAKIKPGIDAIVDSFGRIGSSISKGLGSAQFSNILKGLQTGLLAGILLTLKKFMSGGLGGFHVDVGKGIFGQVKETLEGVTGTLKSMQNELKAKALLEIAIAMGVLAVSVVALANTNPEKVQAALKAMAVGFGELLGAMAILTKISGSAGFVKIPIIAASLDLLAGAILILSIAVIALSQLSWQELEKGLGAVAILLAAISAAAVPLSANSSGLIRAGVGITAVAIALNILYIAVKAFSTLSWSEMLKGFAGIGIALGGLAVAMRLLPTGMAAQGAGLLLVAVALNALYLAVKDFSNLNYSEMLKGLAGVAGALVAIAIGMRAMPPGMIAQAVALNIVALALLTIDKAVASMAQMSWTSIAKGLIGLGGALLVLAGGLALMDSSLAGAVALGIVALGISSLVDSLQALASMSIGQIITSLVTLAATFGIIGVAALLLTPVIPEMLALGVALGLVGVAMLAFGAGAALLGVGLTSIAAAGGAAVGVLIGGLTSLITLLPTLAANLATALVSFITIIGTNAPAIVGALVSVLQQLLAAIPAIIPNLIIAINSIVQAILTVLVTNAPAIIQAGLDLLLDLLSGISNNISKVVDAVANIIANFLNALADNIGKIIDAGVNLLTKFLVGVANALGKMPGVVLQVIGAFVTSLANNLGTIVSSGVKMLGSLLSGITGRLGDVTSSAVQAVAHFVTGIADHLPDVAAKGVSAIDKFITGVGSKLQDLAQAGYNLASSLIRGIINGIRDLAGNAISAVGNMVSSLVDKATSLLHIGGPSQVFDDIGRGIGDGLINGVSHMHRGVVSVIENIGKDSIVAMRSTIRGINDAVATSGIDYNPVITPVLDLSMLRKNSKELNSYVSPSLMANVSSDQALKISLNALPGQSDSSEPSEHTPTVFTFEQNNYSPKALSAFDIYRQTKNQLAQTKSALGLP